METTLPGKVALVTGGSRGLGVAIASALVDQGADVAISYVASNEKAAAIVASLTAKGVRAAAIKSDQGDPASAEPLRANVIKKLGKLDILVNNAAIALQGITIDSPAYDSAAMDRQWAVNTAGVIANIRAAARHLPDHGRIISVGSGLARRTSWPGGQIMPAPRPRLPASRGVPRAILARATSPSMSWRRGSWKRI
jgi:NAD(P)-dependent dehydrogenase (short-subunit alcohol dehydrogenase family)